MEESKKISPIESILTYAAPHKAQFILSVILAILGVISGLVPYLGASRIIVKLLEGNRNTKYFMVWCGIALVAYLIRVILLNISTSISHKATFTTLKEIRKKLISKLTRMPMGDILDTPSGVFKNIIVDRVESMEVTLAHLLPEMTANIIGPVLIIIILFIMDWRMALISLITMPVGFAFMTSIMKTYPEQYAGSVKINRQMNSTVVEYVNGIEVIKAFNQSANSYGKYSEAVNSNAAYFYNWMKSCQWPMAMYTAVCPSVLITVLPAGFLFFMAGSLEAAQFITIIILSLSIVGPILAASEFTDSLASIGTVLKELEFIENAPELVRPNRNVNEGDMKIELQNISFTYKKDSSENALSQVSLTIEPQTVTALVGPSGSGKSTITKLIAGFWDVTNGDIKIGGNSIKNIPQAQLASMIAYVSQDNYLFDDTIRENIRMGNPKASDSEVEEAAKNAGCDKFIRGLEKGYETMVGGAGGHISGGERQRIAIARAMLKNAPIVILDEATAYIDPENEAIVQKAVGKLVAKKTLIVIAHRLSTIIDSDQIIVMKEGKVSAIGSHNQLLKNSSLYHEMWNAHIGVKDGENV